jgi:4-hydroxy-3-methylbut-2-en-1-yl diphosphate reductase
VEDLEISGPVSYLTQTTLAVDETNEVVDALRTKFPNLLGPGSDDICYATTNRQVAVKAVAEQADLVLVVGSKNSSNSVRMVELANRSGTPAYLIDDASEIDPSWLTDARVIGVSAGASAPPRLVDEVVAALNPAEITEVTRAEETIQFMLPLAVRRAD